MKRHLIIYCSLLVWIFTLVCACSNDETVSSPANPKTIPMTFDVTYPGQTRVSDNAFEEDDSIGLFVADADSVLALGGNLVNNRSLTLKGGTWAASSTIYWDEGRFNAYAYYPYIPKMSSTDAQPFAVSLNQHAAQTDSTLSGYEASDLLYALSEGVEASVSPVKLQFRHVMSRLKIRLVKGEDYEGEMPEDAEVYVLSTVPKAVVDLGAGVVTRAPRAQAQTIRTRYEGNNTYAAIVVPQRIDERLPLIEVVMNGISYLYESRFVFKPGVEHTVNLVISDNPVRTKISIGGEVKDW